MDLASLLIIASGEATEKAPFYVLGIALGVWAVVLSAIGLLRPSFPGNATGARAVMGITALLVVGTVGATIITASG